MSFSVKIFGAGSIGNHLAHASRSLGWDVVICDISQAALDRTRNEIYPTRYGKWDEAIELCSNDAAPTGGADLVVVGTPPDTHLPLAREAVEEKPKAILIEKPLCGPDLDGAADLVKRADELGVKLFVGYDHVVSKVTGLAGDLLANPALGTIQTIDVEFREYWGGIFKAHPWLAGPWETYLGFWKKGGGASGEHSHALNLWQHLAHLAGAGRVVEVQAMMELVTDARVDYDKICLMNLKTESGLVGRCVQDVVTEPSRKWARVQGESGFVDWTMTPGQDRLRAQMAGQDPVEQSLSKTRPDDFITELRHIEATLKDGAPQSPIALTFGLDTMLAVAAAHLSRQTGRSVAIDYSAGPRPEALSTL